MRKLNKSTRTEECVSRLRTMKLRYTHRCHQIALVKN